ncbi:alpha/beta hydrolase [Terrihabitans sp. B22-R8]|uniref:alpha/beta hydrolase n=1 Tax=Terrihabitans sp. B22-R8 TaxID=3425128 RepID=UPI00403D1B66
MARSFRRLCAVTLLAAGVAGCAGMDNSNINPANYPSDVGAGSDVVVVTTRKAIAQPLKDPWFGPQRADASMARVKLSSPHLAGRFSMAAAGLRDWKIENVEPIGSTQLPNGGTRDVLVYIHGYNETFESAVLDAARLSDALAYRGRTVAFSWPSRNSVFDYMADRESAVWSRDALEDTLNNLLADPGVGRVHIVAHSMGSMLTVEALRQVYGANRGAANRFGAVVFASPDIDVDSFSSSVRRLGSLHRQMTVITSMDDRALAVSARLAGGKRVGRAESAALEKLGIKVVDTSGMSGGLLKHATFLRDKEVQKLIAQAIADARVGTTRSGPSPFPVFEPNAAVTQQPLASVPAPAATTPPPAASPAPASAPAIAPAPVAASMAAPPAAAPAPAIIVPAPAEPAAAAPPAEAPPAAPPPVLMSPEPLPSDGFVPAAPAQ